MATYAIGDVQGCFETLTRLLGRIGFEATRDRLWLVGDLVNRGPRSLEVLRWAYRLGERAVSVLGNHDLHLLARAFAGARPKRRDTLDGVLAAPDRDELLGWLRSRPLVHAEGPRLLVHAGLAPAWDPERAAELAREAEEQLRGPGIGGLLAAWQREPPLVWEETLGGPRRGAALLVHLTQLRTLQADGRLCLRFSGPPEQAPPGCLPWFAAPGRRSRDATIVCGHWAALGLRREPGLLALDTACVWGGSLSAVRLEDGCLYQEPFADAAPSSPGEGGAR